MSWFRRKAKAAAAAPAAVLGALRMYRPWVRPQAHPLPNNVAGAFLSIANEGPQDERLVSAGSPLAERIDLCGIKVVDADIEMRPLAQGLAIRAGDTTILKPRGYHLLLVGVRAPLVQGSTLPITLSFEKAGAAAVDFTVEEPGLVGEAILNEEHHRG